MNRILKSALLFISAVCFLVSCKTKVEPQDSYLPVTYINLEGTWKLDSYMGNALPENSYVYIKLQRSDSKFTIYDNQASGLVRVKTGTFLSMNRHLSLTACTTIPTSIGPVHMQYRNCHPTEWFGRLPVIPRMFPCM